MLIVEGNLLIGYCMIICFGLLLVIWCLFNYGVQLSKLIIVQVIDGIGMLEIYVEIDKFLVDLNGNIVEFWLLEDCVFFEVMNQQMV